MSVSFFPQLSLSHLSRQGSLSLCPLSFFSGLKMAHRDVRVVRLFVCRVLWFGCACLGGCMCCAVLVGGGVCVRGCCFFSLLLPKKQRCVLIPNAPVCTFKTSPCVRSKRPGRF